jgi:tetratricopeptide (TPR) repeat protein
MLGLLHVPDVAPPVVAAMLATPAETARTALDRLVDAQLVEPVTGGRYRLHDLVRLVAAERATDEEPAAARDDAVTSAIAYYTGGIWGAMSKARPSRVQPFGDPPVPERIALPALAGLSGAKDWIDSELASLEAALAQAGAMAGDAGRFTRWLSDALWENLDIRCNWPAAYRVSQLTIQAAERLGDRELTALGLLLHGRSEACLGSYQTAIDYLEQALAIMRELGNGAGVALVLNGLGIVHERRAEPDTALSRYEEALDLAVAQAPVSLAASVLNNMSVSYAHLDQLAHAVAACKKSIALSIAEGDRITLATANLNVSAFHCLRGDYAAAVQCADEAVRLSQQAGDRQRACEALIIRSVAKLQRGHASDAQVDVEKVLMLAQASGHRYASAVAQRQRSKILRVRGRLVEASDADSAANDAFARLTGFHRDPTIELLLRR